MRSQEFQFATVTGFGESGDVLRDGTRSDAWRQVVAQVESSLCREDRSRQALDQLQQLATDQGSSTQILLRSVIRETIRLTMEYLAGAKELLSLSSPVPGEDIAPKAEKLAASSDPILTPEDKQLQDDAAMVKSLNQALKNVVEPSLFDRLRAPSRTQVSPEVLRQQAINERTQSLQALCNRIHTQRQRLGLTLRQIHAETVVALHHLQALDEGKIDRLPEDVYLRGFLRRLEKCLGLPEGDLTGYLPNAIAVTSPIANRQPLQVRSTTNLTPVFSLPSQPNYAYLTYAALMAGGVFWVSQQGSPKSNLAPLKIDRPQPIAPATVGNSQKLSIESVQKTHMQVSQNVSAPEFFTKNHLI